MLAKSLSFLAGADAAGIVLGAQVPIILTSRADSVMARLASCARRGAGRAGAARDRRRRRSPERAMADAIARPERRLVEHQVLAVRRHGARARRSSRAGRSRGSTPSPRFVAKDGAGATVGEKAWGEGATLGHDGALEHLVAFLRSRLARAPARRRRPSRRARRTRVRRAGARRRGAWSTRSRSYVPLAPLHQPHNLAPIRALLERAAGAAAGRLLRHRVPPRAIRRSRRCSRCRRSCTDAGVRRYGFHGLSYEYIASVLPAVRRARGARQDRRAAPRQRREHVRARRRRAASRARWASPRSTACRWARAAAALDPGVILYLMDERGMDARAIEKLIYQQSGLLGVSGISSDMRTLLGQRRAAARRRRSTSSSTGSAASSARSPPRSAGSTRSSSRRASARTPRRSASASAARRPGSASSSTPTRTRRGGPRISTAASRVCGVGRSRPTRS